MYKIEYDKKALKHIDKLQNQPKVLKKLSEILEDISTNPYSPNFKFEGLKSNFSGYCSKRLDKENRIIYQVLQKEIVVLVVSVLGHYED